MRPRRPLYRLSGGLALLACATLAQADTDIFFSDLPVVASVSRLPQRQADAPSSVTVIDRDTLRASGVRHLSDIFRLVPGFQTFASSDAVARVNYHGITDDNDYSPRVQVLVDGRSLHSPLFMGGMNWALVPVALEDIERIEVVRGSNTTSYGTNAFLGVINIITVDPALVRGVSVSTNLGSNGVRDYTVRGGRALGENGSLRMSYQRSAEDGPSPHTDPRHRAVPDWDGRQKRQLFDLAAHLQIGAQDALDLNLGRVEGELVNGRWASEFDENGVETVFPGVPRPSDPIRHFDQASTWLQLRWLRTLSESSDFSLRYTHSVDTASDAFTHPELAPGYARIDETGDRGSRHELEAVHTFLAQADTRVVWGGSWRNDKLEAKTLLHREGAYTRDVGRVFGNAEWRPSTWFTGNVGVSYESDSLAGKHWAPRASASFHLNEQNTLRIGYARAWRTAGTVDYRADYRLSEDTQEWASNPDLPAERLDSWEIGYLGDWHDLRMSLDVRLFHETISDRHLHRINAYPDAPDTVQALQDITIKGLEYQWKWQPVRNTRLTFGQSHQRLDSELTSDGKRLADPASGSNFQRGLARYVALAERSAPQRSSFLLLQQRLPADFELSIAHYRVGSMKWTRNTEVKKYHRTDLRLARAFNFGMHRGEIAYTVQSLEGKHFEQRMQREIDRLHWVSLQLDF